MAVIPLGEFDSARVGTRTGVSRVENSGLEAPARAMQQLGQTAENVGMQIVDGEQRRVARVNAEAEAKRDALTRVEMISASTDFELQVAAEQDRFGEDLAAGRVDFRNATHEWGNRMGKVQPPPLQADADEVMSAQYRASLHQTRERARIKVEGNATRAQQAHFEATAVDTLNKNVTLAGMPGGNTAEAIQRNQGMEPLLRAAGYDEARAAAHIRTANQAIYSNEAKGRIDAAGRDAAGLNAVLQDLTAEGGRYVGAIDDPSQRLVLANSVRSRLQQLETQDQQAADARAEAAKRTVSAVWDQATSGVRPGPDMLTNWQKAVAGTPQEPEFVAAVNALQDVYGVLRESPEKQAGYLQDLRAKLAQGGGTPEDQTRIDRIETVIERSNKQRDTEPLLWLSNMTGQPVEPIDIQGAVQSGDLASLGNTVQTRMDAIGAVRGQFGPSVAMHPLLPQEAKALAAVVSALPPDRLTGVFGVLRERIGTDSAYEAVMQQIAPDAPLKAYAGLLAVRPGGGKTASLILRGDALLANKEGKEAWPMPADGKFTEAFLGIAGNAYQGRPQDLQRDMAAARAVYAAAAAQDGASEAGKTFDPERFANATRAVVGEVAEVGPTRVTVPWGTSADVFESRATALASDALHAAKLDPNAAGVGLMATSRPGRYILVQGRTPVWNPTVELAGGRLMPLFIDWTPPPPEAARDRKVKNDAAQATLRGTR